VGRENITAATIDFPNLFTREQIDYIGQSVVDAARQICGDKLHEVILYGSYARGDCKEWSDVDIMVLADIDVADRWRYNNFFIEDLYDLFHHMNLLLSVIVTPYALFERMKEVYPFYRNVDKDGKRLCPIANA